MHYLITGGTGFIGSALTDTLIAEGHQVTISTRQSLPDQAGRRYVDDLAKISADSRFDAVVNLAGASLAGSRWTRRYKQEIVASRLDTTREVVALCRRLEQPPGVLLSASAIGYYGHHGDELLDEDGAGTPGFSRTLCIDWENAALKAVQSGTRVCLLRFGVVLDRDGGAMVEMARPFRFGVANWLGDGRQWLSWVHRQDAVAAIQFLQYREDLSGPFNITAPEPVTSRGFCDVMKKHQRTLVTAPMPAPVMRLLVGEMADELLLNGQRVIPARLQAAGFDFQYPRLDLALAEILSG
jgi:uncharacterized protein (TIGR01777 family)